MPPLNFLYTNIGRGHPFYLDGIREVLADDPEFRGDINVNDVFSTSRGLPRNAWRLARLLYRLGASGGLAGAFYTRIRRGNSYDQTSRAMRLMGRDIRKKYLSDSTPLVVAHPSLVGMLRGRPDLYYQHGELVAPGESLVEGATAVLVPTVETGQRFLDAGYSAGQIVVTGLCIEPELAAKAEERQVGRVQRLKSERPLTGLFLSSGAEPTAHVEKIVSAVHSVARTGGRAVVVARKDGRLHRRILPGDSIELLTFTTRAEENAAVGRVFDRIDYVVAPPHERTNWALGLGLPFFALTPTYGPFAPLNLHLLIQSGTSQAFGDSLRPETFGESLSTLRSSGRLAAMAEAGWGKYPIDGFRQAARFLRDISAKA